jgi:hypothetical protein
VVESVGTVLKRANDFCELRGYGLNPWPYGPKPYARVLVLTQGVARAIARGHMECIRPCKRGAPSLGGDKSPF